MVVRISSTARAAILAHAASDPAREVCGVLLGAGMVEEATPARNVAANPTCRFEIDPADLLAAHRAARSGGLPVIGHYHSHPNGLCWPSATDAGMSHADGTLWLIAGAGTLRGFRAVGAGGSIHDAFEPVELAVS